MRNFYLTFGVKYRHEPHPFWKGADPSGWVTIVAGSEPEARRTASLYFGEAWSMLYPDNHFNEALNKAQFYPRGEIARIEAGNVTEGVGLPTPRFEVSDPRFHGHEDTDIVACRIEGRAKARFRERTSDSFEELGYDAVVVHPQCFERAVLFFAEVTDVDRAVQAGELDWTDPQECDVCEVSIT